MAAKRRPLFLAILVVGATLVALGLGEVVLRMMPGQQPLGELSYATEDGTPVGGLAEGMKLGFVTMVPADQTPRPRGMFAPDHRFYLCYADQDRLQNDWMDEQGRVLVRINSRGIREREELAAPKPEGQQRIVCIGDSFTFGWGITEERGWVRRLEGELREDGRDVRTVNCGAAGAIVVDEYQWGLEKRFGEFEPDAVIVTLCLNDLIPCSGLWVRGPAPDTGSRLIDLVLGAFGHSPLNLDPDIDWVGLLLGLSKEAGEEGGMYTPHNPYDAMWSQGTPQRALGAMKEWCAEREVKFMVVLWPFLQGLGPGRWYPFAKLHELVATECERQGIAFLDVLPALADTPHEELWVTPADMHPNPKAIELVMPRLVPFVREHL